MGEIFVQDYSNFGILSQCSKSIWKRFAHLTIKIVWYSPQRQEEHQCRPHWLSKRRQKFRYQCSDEESMLQGSTSSRTDENLAIYYTYETYISNWLSRNCAWWELVRGWESDEEYCSCRENPWSIIVHPRHIRQSREKAYLRRLRHPWMDRRWRLFEEMLHENW